VLEFGISSSPCVRVLCGCDQTRPTSQAGYALVDAMVALLMLSLTLIFGLRAAGEARHAADQASEARRAQALMAGLLNRGPRTFSDSSGTTDAFSWSLQTRGTGADQPVAICHRAVALTGLASHRVYRAATLETCPVETAG